MKYQIVRAQTQGNMAKGQTQIKGESDEIKNGF